MLYVGVTMAVSGITSVVTFWKRLLCSIGPFFCSIGLPSWKCKVISTFFEFIVRFGTFFLELYSLVRSRQVEFEKERNDA